MSCSKVYNYKLFAGELQKKNKAPEKEAQCDELPDCQASAKWQSSLCRFISDEEEQCKGVWEKE